LHFLSEIIKTPILKGSVKEKMNIHRHFYRYSRGQFIGPALKITKTAAKITLRGSHEYEDLIQEVVTRTISADTVNINVILITGADITNIITNLGLDWKLIKSKGKTKNYKTTIQEYTISKDILLESIETFRESSYLLLSYNLNPSCKVTTKKRIPQPSKKKPEDDAFNKRIQFCSGVIENTERNLEMVIDEALPDFKSEIPNKWRNIIITNIYKITDIELPTNINNSILLRIFAIRKGKILRSIEVDGELIEKQYSVVV